MNLTLGFCRLRTSVQGLLMPTIIYMSSVQCFEFCGFGVTTSFWLLLWRRRRRKDVKISKFCGVGLLGYGNDEREWVVCGSSRREEGRTSGMPSEVCWIRAYVKAGLLDYLDQLDQQKRKPKEEWPIMVITCWMHFRSWMIDKCVNVTWVLLALAAG